MKTMNKKIFYLFSSRQLLSLCYIFLIACVFCLFITILNNNGNDRAKIYRYSYPDLQSIFRTRNFHLDLFQDEKRTTELLTTSQSQSSTEDSVEKQSETDYRINTNGCKIKSLPLFDNETIKLFENKTETIWKCKPDIIHIKRFDETWIMIDWTELDYKPLCYYRQLSRGSDDFHFKYGEFKGPLKNTTINFPEYNFVHILCYKNTAKDIVKRLNSKFNPKDKDLIHNQIIPLIPVLEKKTDSDVPNVLLLAIDSTSYINFKRHFIRTEKFLNKNNFYELRGYTKVGINTFPNMIPFLVGHHVWEIVNYDQLMKTKFDDWPIVWKPYSEKGFVTAFVEEMGTYGLFQFKGQGFRNKPTDYETRPFHMESKSERYNDFCYRDRTETEHSLDFTYDFLKAMNKRQQKYFAYISISEMTHDWLNAGHYMDVPYNNFFTKIFKDKLVDNTVIFFFSDHGLRLGPIRMTRTGEVENRLPFMFIHVPEDFNQDYVENLKQNQFKLTTPFDIHATMVNLIKGEPNRTLPHGLSLIDDVISDNRDCHKAAIPDQFCSCFDDIPEHDFSLIKPNETIPKIVKSINWYSRDYRKVCTEYEFASIKTIYLRKLTRTLTEEDKDDDSRVYLIHIYVNPGMALFETIIKGYDGNTRFDVINEMNRINRFGEQSHCISHKIIKNFCYCKDLLKD